jgi:thiol:disulfide interchange protein DsbD
MICVVPRLTSGLLLVASVAPSIDVRAADAPIRATLVASVSRFRPGEPFDAALRLEAGPGWHTYWINPGEAGLATEVRWMLPRGFTAGPLRWPAPKRFVTGGVVSFGYDGVTRIPVEIRPPADWPTGRVATLRARVDWLGCHEECVPGGADVEIAIPAASAPVASDEAEAVARALALLPRSDARIRVEARAVKGGIAMRVEGAGVAVPGAFFPVAGGILRAALEPAWARAGGIHETVLALEAGVPAPARMAGVLAFGGPEARAPAFLDFEIAGRTVPQDQ